MMLNKSGDAGMQAIIEELPLAGKYMGKGVSLVVYRFYFQIRQHSENTDLVVSVRVYF